MRGRPDVTSLVGGIAIASLGVVLLLDSVGMVDVRFAALAPIVCATMGAILVASGLSRRD